jgi:hypothetical protein
MSARFLPVSNTFLEVLPWFSDMAECPRQHSIGGAAIVSAGAYPRTTILHLNVRPIEGANGLQFSTAQVYNLPAIDRQLRKGSKSCDTNQQPRISMVDAWF